MGKDLSHLTSEEIETLMRRYYDGEAVSKLIKEYNISAHASELYKLFPPEVYQNYSCEYCDEFLVINRPSKTTKDFPKYERDLYCPICGHKPFQSHCRCKNCLEEERLLRIEQLEQIQEVYSRAGTPVDFSSLSFESKVFLGALCRALLKENLYEIVPYSESEVVLTPTDDLRKKLYSNLIHDQIIAVSPQSPLEAFATDSEDFPNTFYTYKVTYFLNLVFPPNKQDLFTEILNPSYYSADCANEALVLWREIAVADASKLYLEKGISKKHAANSVIGACERYAGRAKINGWDLTQYNRIKDLPQSELSLFYFNRVLGIGEMGFRVPPTIV